MPKISVPKTVRSVSFGLATVVTTLAVLPVSGEFFVKLAEENGLYERPTERVGFIMSAISDLVNHPVFPWIAGIIIGFAIGVWLDTWMRKLDRHLPGSATVPVWRPEGLHVSWMTVNAKRLDTDLVMEIAVHGFNATGSPISIADMRGNIRFREALETPPEMGVDLPPPVLLRDRTRTRDIADLDSIFFVIQQHLPRDVAERISARMEGGKRVRLDFGKIDITVSQAEPPLEMTRLPLWDSATMHRSAEQVWLMEVREIQAIDILAFGLSDNVRTGA